jgi:DNA replication protein DnaC
VLKHCTVCGSEGRLRWLAQHCGLEHSEQQRTLADFQSVGPPEHLAKRANAKKALQQAIAQRHGLYTFWGDFGSGKTLALQIAVNELRRQMVEGYYAPFAAIVDHLRNLFATQQDSSRYWQRLLDVPVLALDEVSRFDDGRAWIRDRLFVLADTRYRQKQTHLTLFATNSNPTVALPTSLRGDVRSVA